MLDLPFWRRDCEVVANDLFILKFGQRVSSHAYKKINLQFSETSSCVRTCTDSHRITVHLQSRSNHFSIVLVRAAFTLQI